MAILGITLGNFRLKSNVQAKKRAERARIILIFQYRKAILQKQ